MNAVWRVRLLNSWGRTLGGEEVVFFVYRIHVQKTYEVALERAGQEYKRLSKS